MPDEMDTLVAAVTCPKCGKKHALLDTPEYKPGKQPKRFPGTEPVTFPCCGDAQTAHPESVKYHSKKSLV